MPPAEEPRARPSARARRGTAILASLIEGASVEQIAIETKLSTKRVETLLREELRRRWVAPARDYARIQIARLEAIGWRLKAKSERGDLPTIDRLLRIMDRLDRYHGFTRLTPSEPDEYAGSRAKLFAKLNANYARLAPTTPDAQ